MKLFTTTMLLALLLITPPAVACRRNPQPKNPKPAVIQPAEAEIAETKPITPVVAAQIDPVATADDSQGVIDDEAAVDYRPAPQVASESLPKTLPNTGNPMIIHFLISSLLSTGAGLLAWRKK